MTASWPSTTRCPTGTARRRPCDQRQPVRRHLVAACKPPSASSAATRPGPLTPSSWRWRPPVACRPGQPTAPHPAIAIIDPAKGTVRPVLDHSSGARTGHDAALVTGWAQARLLPLAWPDRGSRSRGGTVHRERRRERPAPADPLEAAVRDPDWSPDGSRIACAARPHRYVEGGPSGLYVLRPDGSGLHARPDNGPNRPRATQPRSPQMARPSSTSAPTTRTGTCHQNTSTSSTSPPETTPGT